MKTFSYSHGYDIHTEDYIEEYEIPEHIAYDAEVEVKEMADPRFNKEVEDYQDELDLLEQERLEAAELWKSNKKVKNEISWQKLMKEVEEEDKKR